MNYKRYYDKLTEKNIERSQEFLDNHIFRQGRDKDYYMNHFSFPRGIQFNFVISSSHSKTYGRNFEGLVVELYIKNIDYHQSYFEQLKQNKKNIEEELSVENIVWQSSEETIRGTVCRVFAKKAVNIDDENRWNEYIDWQLNTMIKFLEVFPYYTDKLNDIGSASMSVNEEKFINYLRKTPSQRGKIPDESRIRYLVKVLKMEISDKLNEVDNTGTNGSLFNIENINYLKQIKKRLNTGGDLYTWDQKNHGQGGCSAALHQYIKFLNEGSNPRINEPLQQEALGLKIRNIILYGSPGVGKTYSHKKLISLIEANDFNEKEIFDLIISNNEEDIIEGSIEEFYTIIKDEKRMKFITFHQSFGYEDFIEGFRPNDDGDIKLQDGIFKSICDDANKDKDNKYYLVIDEINRGNISKIFGELITLIEEDKRDTLEVTLPYSKKPFKIPSNLYIIGTMNSTDKSIALIDIALRRRFTFLKMEPKSNLVKNVKAKKIMELLNDKLIEIKMEDYVLGHSYFMKVENDDDLEFVLEYKIMPLLEEYFYGDVNGYNQVIKVIDDNAKSLIE